MNHKTVMTMAGDVILVHRRWRGWRKEFGSLRSYYASHKIQRDSGSRWNHVAIMKTYTLLTEAQERVKVTLLAYYADNPEKYAIRILRYKHLDADDRRAVGQWAFSQLGDSYDWWLIAKIKLVLMLQGIIGLKLLLVNNAGDKFWICSELVQAAFLSAGVNLHGKALMYPGDFDNRDDFEVVYESESLREQES